MLGSEDYDPHPWPRSELKPDAAFRSFAFCFSFQLLACLSKLLLLLLELGSAAFRFAKLAAIDQIESDPLRSESDSGLQIWHLNPNL